MKLTRKEIKTLLICIGEALNSEHTTVNLTDYDLKGLSKKLKSML